MQKLFLVILLFISSFGLSGQERMISLNEAIDSALKSHPQLQLSQQEVEQQKALKKGSFNLQNPDVWIESPTTTKFTLGVQQTFDSPFSYIRQSKLAKSDIKLAEIGLTTSKIQLVRDVKIAYLNLQFSELKVKQLAYQDSIFKSFSTAMEKQFNTGETDLLAKVSAETKSKEISNQLMQAQADLLNDQFQLKVIMGIKDENIKTSETLVKIAPDPANIEIIDTSVIKSSPFLQYYQQNIISNSQALKLERSRLAPGLMVGYLNQGDVNSQKLYRFQFGLSVPIWFWTYSSQIKAANIRLQMANSQYTLATINYSKEYQQALTDYKKNYYSLIYFETNALNQADTIIDITEKLSVAGEIGYFIYLQSLNQAFEIKMNYYETLRNYNQSAIELNYLKGQL